MEYNELKMLVGNNETVMWEGKPDKKCFILESIFNPFLPFALIWGMVDFGIIAGFALAGETQESGMTLFLLMFFLLHLMPVWIYLGGIATSVMKYNNTYYIVTDRAIYKSSGIFSTNTDVKLFADMSNVSFHRGIIDKMIGVGDVIVYCNTFGNESSYYSNNSRRNAANKLEISDIREFERVFKMVKELQTDIYADVMYPNALRPENNPGYNTKYNGDW